MKLATSRQEQMRDRKALIAGLEARREKLQISKRALSKKAGLNASYYQHLVAGGFQFPTIRKLNALQVALDRLEKIAEFEAGLQ